ncbi:MAG: dihydropyrimidinase [Fulvimarina manganoxydans]|uniref:dihydropyrimidinase n=1 Tax=Fulvimarina manganoxydans TaxID=937218 RepID=UPI00235291AB|nr:dihydropyrimidinase [Fulvimarina manganoxydans]MCK5932965.1 dihydropyrimidinase [Fulvimarina manganoxydans]
MTASELDLAIRGGRLVTSSGTFEADLGISNGTIVQIGRVGAAAETMDANGLLILPGGVDTHCHLDQVEPGMGYGAESFASGGRSALAGGTTSAISFIAQFPGAPLKDIVAESHKRGQRSRIDYSFHQIITDASDEAIAAIPEIVASGVRSLKVFLTYEDAHVTDREFLRVLAAARREGAMVAVHCENYDAIGWLTEALIADGKVAPKYHAWSRPKVVEREATYRAIAFSELVDQPIQVFHVSCAEVAEEIERAQRRGLKVWGETCPQYLVLTENDMDRPGFEGAKYMCSPSPREPGDADGLWEMIRRGVIDVVSSDHSAFNTTGNPGKDMNGRDAPFRDIPNGVPGVGSRMPIVFSEGVSKGRISLEQFVQITATNPARLYGLAPRKGDIAIGADADIVFWDAERTVTITNDRLQHAVDYTPYEGLKVKGWPVATLLRGQLAMRDGEILLGEGAGEFLARAPYEMAQPTGRLAHGFDASRVRP